MTMSGSGWGSNPDHDMSAAPQTTDEFDYNQKGKPAKAIIGLGILVAFSLALAFFHPTNHDASSSSAMVSNSSHPPGMNSTPGQTTGQSSAR